MKKKETSLKTTTGMFFFYLIVIAVDRVDLLYIPLKQSISVQSVPGIAIYSAELIAIIAFGIALVKAVQNIRKQNFFVKENVKYFTIMGVVLILPPLTKTIGDIIDWSHDWKGYIDISLWLGGALFMLIIREIFRYGMKLKEEQDLTV